MRPVAYRTIIGFSLLIVLLLIIPAFGAQKFVIKIATLASEGSPWMQVFNELNADIMKKTDKKVRFRLYPGGILGDEGDIIRKMYIGQIHGAALTASNLTSIFKEMDVFQVPFLFQNYNEVDHVLQKMDQFFKKGFESNGYVLLGWSEGGFVRLMSMTPIVTFDDLRRAKVWIWEESPMTRAIFKEAGVTGIPLSIPDVMVGLQTGLVDVVYVPPAGAIDLQWFRKIKYITDFPLIYLAGVIVLKKDFFDRMPKGFQDALLESFSAYMVKLKEVVRNENREALKVMAKHGVKIVKPSKEQIEEFKRVSQNAIRQPGSRKFSDDVLSRLSGYLDTYRRMQKQ